MIQSFLEWVQVKEELLEVANYKDLRSEAGTHPEAGDFVILNSSEVFLAAISQLKAKNKSPFESPTPGTQEPKETDLESLAEFGWISDVANRNARISLPGQKMPFQVWADSDNFRDITDMFPKYDMMKKRVLAFMGLTRNARKDSDIRIEFDHLKLLYRQWRALQSSNVDPAEVATKNAMQGKEKAEGEVIKKGKQEVNNHYIALAQRVQAGEDISSEIIQMKDDFQKRRLAQHLRAKGAGALADKAHEVLGSENIKGEENGPPEQEPDFEKMLMQPQTQKQQATEIPLSPFEKLFAQPQTQKQQATEIPQQQYSLQGRNIVMNPQQMAAVNAAKPVDPEIQHIRDVLSGNYRKAEGFSRYNRLWKSHNDLRHYEYLPE